MAVLVVGSGSMVNVSLPAVRVHFDAAPSTTTWIVTAYMLTFAIMGTVHGRAVSFIGARRLYLSSLLVIGLSSLATTFAPSMAVMLGARAIQGIGAAAIPVLGTLIVTRVSPPDARAIAVGQLLGASALATTVGPILGGIFVQYAGWRLAFACPVLALTLIPIGARQLPRFLDDRLPTPSFDIRGAVLLCIGVASIMLGISALRSSVLEFGVLVSAGTFFLAVLVVWSHHAVDPFLPPAVIREGGFILVASITLLSQATRVGVAVLTPVLLIEVHGIAPAWVGPILLPGAVVMAKLSPLAGRWSLAVGIRMPISLGLVGILTGTILTAGAAGGAWPGVCAGTVLCSCGFALVQSPSVNAVSALISAPLLASGLGVFMMLSFLGAALGAAVAATMLGLHHVGDPSWLGLAHSSANGYSNALCALAVFAAASLPLALRLPREPAKVVTL